MFNIDPSTHAERLRAQGYSPEQARTIAMRAAGRALHNAIHAQPTEAVLLADKVRAGSATLSQLADVIAKERHMDRESAFGEAERMLRNTAEPSERLVSAVPLDRSVVANSPVSIVTLADKIAQDKGVDRETAFAMAEKQLTQLEIV